MAQNNRQSGGGRGAQIVQQPAQIAADQPGVVDHGAAQPGAADRPAEIMHFEPKDVKEMLPAMVDVETAAGVIAVIGREGLAWKIMYG